MASYEGYLLTFLFSIFTIVFLVRVATLFLNHRADLKCREIVSQEPPILVVNSKVSIHQPWGYIPIKGGDKGELEISVREHSLQVSLPPQYYGKVPGAEYYLNIDGMTIHADQLSIVVTGRDRNKTRKLLIKSGIHTEELLGALKNVMKAS